MAKYLENKQPLEASFKSPSSLYRGAPFWSWNGDLNKEELLRQLDVFREMGIGGAMLHPRTGLNTPYLSDDFMDLVKDCREHAHANDMFTWLYDEDRWPSGFAGGLVTKDPEYRQRHVLFTSTPYQTQASEGTSHNDATAAGTRQGNGMLLARYGVSIKNRYLAAYRYLTEDDEPKADETLWYAYLEVDSASTWFNNQTYVDTLNPKAMQRFIEVTHERYKEYLEDAFGKDVPAIFTDEPQFTHKGNLLFAEKAKDIFLPWTGDLEEDFTKRFGGSILAHLPEVLWDLPDNQPSIWRYNYHEWVAERFTQSFADQIGSWCKANGIALTGHMMEEPTLSSQCRALGEAMRSYRSMGIPGIDMLCDHIELNTAKQAQSAARQYGCPGVLSELYGVTGWHFDFQGHKRQGDWQAALGVLFRVHHLSWYCMRGEAKRDYPASIHYQSPWYKEYPTIEDHFARVGDVLSRGKAVCRVGVIHPIESYWITFGPNDTSATQTEKLEQQFSSLTDWLLRGLIDFDFIAESLLPEQNKSICDKTFDVGEMQYEVVIVPGMRTIRETTLEKLEQFADVGGRMLFLGEIPTLVDAVPSDRPQQLAQRCACISFEKAPILDALSSVKDIAFQTAQGLSTDCLLYQMRQDQSDRRFLFICNTNREMFMGNAAGTLRIAGHHIVSEMDTSSGSITPVKTAYSETDTCIKVNIPATGHLLLQLKAGKTESGISLLPPSLQEAGRVTSPVSISLDEPNVMLFDKAAFSINHGEWQKEMPLLEIENVFRKQQNLPEKQGKIAQPWVDPSPVKELGTISLRATFISEVACTNTAIALENIDESKVLFDGVPIEMSKSGFFTDKAISTIPLPPFEAGEHTIEIVLFFTKETSIEWFYLLGDFGVRMEGVHGIITEPVRELTFGDWTTQGLPFYGGNVTYHCVPPVDGNNIQLPQLKATTTKVQSQGQAGRIYRPPFSCELPIKKGEPIEITVFGHRANCFGPVHLSQPLMTWLGPQSYRTTGTMFSPEYKLQPLGILSAPIIYQIAE